MMHQPIAPIETERETDGRWIAERTDEPGCMAYGATEAEAIANAEALCEHIVWVRALHRELP